MSRLRSAPRRASTVAALVAASVSLRCVSTDGLTESAMAADAGQEASGVTPTEAGGDAATDPTTFASGQGPVVAFASSAGILYWSAPSQGAVRSCPLSGCTTPNDIATGGKPSPLCFKGRLMWGDEVESELFYLDDASQIASTATSTPVGVFCDGTMAYLRGTQTVTRVQNDPPKSFTTFMPADLKATLVAPYNGVALADATKVYIVVGGQPLSVADDIATALALDDSQIFWTTKDGRLRARPRAGGAIVDLASALPEPAGVVSDPEGVNVYFTARGTAAKSYLDGFVAKVPRGGGPTTIIAKDQARPETLVLAGSHVFWSNAFDGTIRRAPK